MGHQDVFRRIVILLRSFLRAAVGLLHQPEEGSAAVFTAGQVVQVLDALRQPNDAGAGPSRPASSAGRLTARLVVVEAR